MKTTTDKTPHSPYSSRCAETGRPRCKVCGNLGTWGAPHYCPGPGGLTGTWVEDHGENHASSRYEVRFAFEGETSFEALDDAREAARAYERIVADAVHGERMALIRGVLTEDEVVWLRAEVDRLKRERDQARADVHGARAVLVEAFGFYCRANPDPDHYPEPWAEVAQDLLGSERANGMYADALAFAALAPLPAATARLRAEVDRLTRERDDLQDAIRVAWEAIDATHSLETETALHTLIQAVPLEVRQRWAREDGG